MDVFDRVQIDDMSLDLKNKALNAINFIIKNAMETSKENTCANGKQ